MKKVRFMTAVCMVSLAIVFACKTEKVNQSSTERLYKKDNIELDAQYCIYHFSDSISHFYYDLSNELLIYKKTDTSEAFYSNVKVFLKISTEDNLSQTHDTASVSIIDKQSDVKLKRLKGVLPFYLKQGLKYYIEVSVFDKNKKTRYVHNLIADKSSKDTRQNFLITNLHNDVFFNSYYKPSETVFVESNRNATKVFAIDVFKPDFQLALPPFSKEPMKHFTYRPDSTFHVYLNSQNKFEIMLPDKGFYHLKTENLTKDGLTFFVYENSFPKIKNSEQMILATRYIMAKKEFDNCLYSADKKEAIDNFWVSLSGSNERAKNLIKKYYGRVQEANRLFSSYQEGWKTDRGMVYIVFGAPSRVTTHKNGETWTYGEIGNPNSIIFTFIKIINPFTDNDYYLERNEILKMPWYQAVDMWRQGRVYLDN